MTFFVYILKSQKTGKFYIGQTNDINSRLNSHNKGYSKYTKPGRSWTLIHSKQLDTRAEAMKLERRLKNFKSNFKLINWISNDNAERVVGPEK